MNNQTTASTTNLDEQESESSLGEFNWDNETTDKSGNFFGAEEKPKKTKAKEIEEEEDEIVEEETTENTEEETEEENEEVEETDDNEEDKEEIEDKKDKDKKDSEKNKPETKLKEKSTNDTNEDSFTAIANTLKEEGILEYAELPKKKKISSSELLEIFSKEKELALDAGLKELFEGLDETGVEYIKFIKSGGKTQDFISTFVDDAIPEINIEDKKTHKDVIMCYALNVEGLDEEDAKAKYDSLKENGTDEKYAKKYYAKLRELDEQKKTELLEKQQRKDKKEQREREEFTNGLSSVFDKDEVLGVPLTPKDKRAIKEMIAKPTNLLDGKKVTKLQFKLNQVFKSPEKLVVLAKLIDNDFNFDFIEQKSQTKNANKIRKSLNGAKDQSKNTKGAITGTSRKTLADYFEQ